MIHSIPVAVPNGRGWRSTRIEHWFLSGSAFCPRFSPIQTLYRLINISLGSVCGERVITQVVVLLVLPWCKIVQIKEESQGPRTWMGVVGFCRTLPISSQETSKVSHLTIIIINVYYHYTLWLSKATQNSYMLGLLRTGSFAPAVRLGGKKKICENLGIETQCLSKCGRLFRFHCVCSVSALVKWRP